MTILLDILLYIRWVYAFLEGVLWKGENIKSYFTILTIKDAMNKSTIHHQFLLQTVSRQRIEEFFLFLNENNINAMSYEWQIWKTALREKYVRTNPRTNKHTQ